MEIYEVIALCFFVFCVAIFVGHTYTLRSISAARQHRMNLQFAKKEFRLQRELIEARFVAYAKRTLDSDIWLWDEADFSNEVLFARNRKDGQLYAYLPIVIEMNRPIRHMHLPKNPLYLRQITAIVQFNHELCQWYFTGTTFFNQTPNDLIERKILEFHLVSSLHDTEKDDLE